MVTVSNEMKEKSQEKLNKTALTWRLREQNKRTETQRVKDRKITKAGKLL